MILGIPRGHSEDCWQIVGCLIAPVCQSGVIGCAESGRQRGTPRKCADHDLKAWEQKCHLGWLLPQSRLRVSLLTANKDETPNLVDPCEVVFSSRERAWCISNSVSAYSVLLCTCALTGEDHYRKLNLYRNQASSRPCCIWATSRETYGGGGNSRDGAEQLGKWEGFDMKVAV